MECSNTRDTCYLHRNLQTACFDSQKSVFLSLDFESSRHISSSPRICGRESVSSFKCQKKQRQHMFLRIFLHRSQKQSGLGQPALVQDGGTT